MMQHLESVELDMAKHVNMTKGVLTNYCLGMVISTLALMHLLQYSNHLIVYSKERVSLLYCLILKVDRFSPTSRPLYLSSVTTAFILTSS